MPPTWTTEQILALAPDAGAAKAGKDLAAARKWRTLGHDAEVAWGTCQGSGVAPYQTGIDLNGPGFRCSCPSRKFPCKHALGLFLLLANAPGGFTETERPEWISAWLAGRARREAATSKPAQADRSAARPTPRTRAATDRTARVMAGLQDLDLWMTDLVRHGLAAAQSRPAQFWETPAARLVDAQAPGVARLVRQLAGIPATGDGWPDRLLERLGRLHLLGQGFRQLDSLPEPVQADIRGLIGWTQSQDELLGAPGLRDQWLVLGQRVTEEDRLRAQHTWLWGRATGRAALILTYAHGNAPLDTSLLPGTAFEADLVYYAGAYPLRALIQARRDPAPLPPALPGYATLAEAIGAYAGALAAYPWLDELPLPLTGVVPVVHGDGWAVQDAEGRVLPLHPHFNGGWMLLALSGGRPLGLFGEWNGEVLVPFSTWTGDRFYPLVSNDLAAPSAAGVRAAAPPRDLHEAHAALVSAALMGTERAGMSLPPLPGTLGDLAAQLAGAPPEHALLATTAALTLYERIGWMPARALAPLPDPAPAEDLSACSSAAGQHLAEMARGRHTMLLPEWLAALAAAHRRVPDEHLVTLLNLAHGRVALQPLVRPVVGALGRWLAAQNASWDYLCDPVEGDVWETGDRAARVALLDRVRRDDPARGREMLAAVWGQEGAADRAAFVRALATGLSVDDEPFLEAALNDRGKEVRRHAADLLARLPGSALSTRMLERLRPLLRWTPAQRARLLPPMAARPARLDVTLPELCDAAMIRDGVEPKANPAVGEKAGWLLQMLSVVAPATWPALWSATPADLVRAAGASEWQQVLLQGWAAAAVRHGDAAWAEALLGALSALRTDDTLNHLIALLPAARWEALVLESLRAHAEPLRMNHPAGVLLQARPALWSPALSRAVLDHLLPAIGTGKLSPHWDVRQLLQLTACCLAPAVLPEALRRWPVAPDSGSPWVGAGDEFLGLVEFRDTMLKEISR
jgi:uncharacterized protein DUF5691/SWIM zinc finger